MQSLAETPILNSPAVFNLLAFIVALAVYLRSVSVNAQELATRIRTGHDETFPYDSASPLIHTTAKLTVLDSTVEKIARVTPWLFLMMLVVALRISLYSAFHLATDRLSFIARTADVILSAAIVVLVITLWYMHRTAKQADRAVRQAAEEWHRATPNDGR